MKSFSVEAFSSDGIWKEIASQTTIGYKRIVPVETTTAEKVRVNITGALACPVLNKFGLYLDTISR